MVPPELLAAAKEGVIRYELLRELAKNAEVSPGALLDGLAALVATDYSSETITFTEADTIMNAAFGVSYTEEFLAENDDAFRSSMFEVYLAFDEGEYYHQGDPPEDDPELKYTKPLIAKYLAAHSNGA